MKLLLQRGRVVISSIWIPRSVSKRSLMKSRCEALVVSTPGAVDDMVSILGGSQCQRATSYLVQRINHANHWKAKTKNKQRRNITVELTTIYTAQHDKLMSSISSLCSTKRSCWLYTVRRSECQCPIPDEEGAKITMFHFKSFLAVAYARTTQSKSPQFIGWSYLLLGHCGTTVRKPLHRCHVQQLSLRWKRLSI